MSPVFGHGRLRLYLLKLLDEAPRHGYEVIRLLQDRFMGVYAPSPGTIYPRLARLEEEGFLTHDEKDGRKIYRITDKGREEINRRLDELEELEREITESVSGIASEVKEDVRETVRSLREELTFASREMRMQGKRSASAHEQARQARDEAREHARRIREEMRQAQAGRDWGDWPAWQDWARWTDWPGRRRDRDRRGAGPDFETLAREFASEVRRAIRQAGALGEGAKEELRLILEDALERIRTEVFGPAKPRQEEEARPADHGGPTERDAETGQDEASGGESQTEPPQRGKPHD